MNEKKKIIHCYNNNNNTRLRLFHVIMLTCGMIAFLINLVHVYGNPLQFTIYELSRIVTIRPQL